MPDLTPRHSNLISLVVGLSNNVFKGIPVILTYHQGGEPLVCLVVKVNRPRLKAHLLCTICVISGKILNLSLGVPICKNRVIIAMHTFLGCKNETIHGNIYGRAPSTWRGLSWRWP